MQPAPQAPQGSNRPNPYAEYYNRWMDTTPYVTRASMIGIVAIYIFSFIIDLTSSLANVPYYTIFKIQIYRIILSPLVSNSILTIILIALFYPSMASRMENALGSTCFLSLICTLSILTNIFFDVTSITLFYMGVSSAIGFSCAGFWTVIFSLITIECMAQPELPRRMLFIPVDIPSKYFPLVLYAFFALFSGGLELGFVIAIAVGYMYSKGFLDKFKLSSNYVDQLEITGGILHSVSRQRGWVLTGLAQGPEAWIPANPNVQRDDNDNNNSGGNGFGSVFGGTRNYQKLSTTDPTSKDNNKQDSFPGRGHTLASAPPISAQDAKEKRLAMLTGNNKIAEISHVSTVNEENLKKITDMGFSRVDAINALQHSGGDLDSAVMSLTA